MSGKPAVVPGAAPNGSGSRARLCGLMVNNENGSRTYGGHGLSISLMPHDKLDPSPNRQSAVSTRLHCRTTLSGEWERTLLSSRPQPHKQHCTTTNLK